MKTVVITGSARGFGFEMNKLFLMNNCNVVLLDINEEELKRAKKELEDLNQKEKVLSYKCDVTKEEDIDKTINNILKEV